MINRFIQRTEDIMCFWISDNLNSLPKHYLNIISPQSFYGKITKIFKVMVKDFIQIFKTNKIPKGKRWLAIETHNNFQALSFLAESENYMLAQLYYTPGRSKLSPKANYIYPRLKFFYDLLFPLFFILVLIMSDKRKNYIKVVDIFFKYIGLYSSYRKMLNKYRPECIVFTNDHNVNSRALLFAAKSLNIATIYIPHASVSKNFPPLKFDLSLLEGTDTKDKYEAIGGITGIIELIGMPKFDGYEDFINLNKHINSIGICYNLGDDINMVVSLVNDLDKRFKEIKLVIRPHPRDNRFVNNIVKSVSLNDSKKESAFDFLKKVDVIISGNSSMILEAALLNVLPIYYTPFVTGSYDTYGFVKNMIATRIDGIGALIEYVNKVKDNKPQVLSKTKIYNSTVNTNLFGQSKKIAFEKIDNLLIDFHK